MKHNLKTQILKSLLVNYPLFSDQNIALDQAILIIPPLGHTKNVIRQFSTSTTNAPLIADTSTNEKRVTRWLTTYRSQAVFFIPSSKNKSDDYLDIFACSMKIGYLDGKKISALPLVISETPYLFNTEEFFTIFFDNSELSQEVPTAEVLPSADEIPRARVLFDEILRDKSETSETEKAFIFAAALICSKSGKREQLDEFLECVDEMIRIDDEFHDSFGIAELFLEEFVRWQSQADFTRIQELPDIGNDTSFDRTIFYNEKYIFLSEDLLKEVVDSISIPINILKKELADEEILVPEKNNRKTYMVKMLYRLGGKSNRVRMLRFDRTKLTKAGEIDFIDAFRILGGE